LLGAVRRRSPSVVGDGRSSIAGLIADENRRRLEVPGYAPFQPLRIDLDCVLALERQGLELGSVPRVGERVRVKGVVSQNAAHENETVDVVEVGRQLVAEARRAASAVGVRLAGVDVVTNELGTSLRAAGGAVLEVNATPGLHYHYQVRDPERAVPVAVPILHALLGG
jgi:D-alanine-D-alanine ligase-like ATP-grasp enzyme